MFDSLFPNTVNRCEIKHWFVSSLPKTGITLTVLQYWQDMGKTPQEQISDGVSAIADVVSLPQIRLCRHPTTGAGAWKDMLRLNVNANSEERMIILDMLRAASFITESRKTLSTLV